MVRINPFFWLEILTIVITLVLYMNAQGTPRKQRVLGFGFLAILAVLVAFFLWPRSPYRGWVICWHGWLEDENKGYEYLIAYPESAVRNGISLGTPLINTWNGELKSYANDSLKACLYNDIWYGGSGFDWFPEA